MMRGRRRGQEVGEHLLGDVVGQRDAVQAGVRRHPDQRALELSDVVDDVVGDERQHVVGNAVEVLGLGLLAQDREARLELRRLDVGDQPPFEPAAQPVLDGRDGLGRPVRRDDDLAAPAVQVVERVEELLLELLGALEELDVVDEQHVDLAVPRLNAGMPLERIASTNSFIIVSVETYRTRLLENNARTWWPMACSRWVFPRPAAP